MTKAPDHGPFSNELSRICRAGGKKLVVVQKLLDENPHLMSEKRHGTSIVVQSVDLGSPQLVSLLLDAGASANFLDDQGFTALHKVIEECNESDEMLQIASLLIDRGASTETVGLNGWRPLHQAVTYGLSQFVELLANRGAKINARNMAIDKESPLEIANRLGHRKIATLLASRGARVPLRQRKRKRGVKSS